MSVIHLIDTVAEWARVNICDHVTLKQPPADLDAPVDGEYEYKRVNPAVFPMYLPSQEKLPPNIHSPFPSLCVQFVAGQDEMDKRERRSVDIQLSFATWNPGTHGKDIVNPDNEQDVAAFFERNADGWRDVWNFVDVALRAIESVSYIDGYTIDTATPVKFGPLPEQEAIPDLYPFWFAWVSFRVTCPLQRNNKDLEDL